MTDVDVTYSEPVISVTIDGDQVVADVSGDGPSVIVTQPVVESSVPDVVVQATVIAAGPRGPQGPEGPIGPKGPPGQNGDAFIAFTHYQVVASDHWVINHGLGYKPGGILIEDSAGNNIKGIVHHIDVDTLTIDFLGGFVGTAFLS